jgi:hypothetical protein
VHCGELTQETFDKSTWPGKLGWVANNDEQRPAALQVRPAAKEVDVEGQPQTKPLKTLQKMGGAIRETFKRDKSRDQLKFRAIAYRSVEEPAAPSLSKTTTEGKSERANLCKEKIRALTGVADIHSRNYSFSALGRTLKPGAEQLEKDTPLLHHSDNKSIISSATSANFSNSHQHHLHTTETSSHFGSLSRSFNSALDRCTDTETTNMDFIRKQAAKLGIRSKRDKKRGPIDKATISDPLPIKSPPTNSPSKDQVDAPEVRRARLEQDDEIIPLGMHTEVETMTKAPVGVRLPSPRLPYPEQLQLTGDYPPQKRESVLDMMQFLTESETKGGKAAEAAKAAEAKRAPKE